MNKEYTTPLSSFWQTGFSSFYQNKIAFIGCVFLLLLLLFAILAPCITPYTYFETHLSLKNTPPCKEFWFGTDELGRDLFTRMGWGARISLFIGIAASCIDLVIGVLFGAFAALSGGDVEEYMMRAADILYSIPYLLVVILLMVILGSGLTTILIALTVTGWIKMARIVRGQTKQLCQMDFVKASVALGGNKKHILLRHLLPNCMGPIFVTLTLTIPSAIFSEAFLSFLGLGIQAPIASWGSMTNDGLSALRTYPWRLFFPAGFISFTLLSFYLIGEGLRDAFDPRIHS
ncbi:MAG: ABC transporter permease [Chlamydiota bacterium]